VSSLALHYLLDAHELNPRVRDRNLSTLLHIVCMHGHVEAFSYLMKKEVGSQISNFVKCSFLTFYVGN